jgi:hypothetical protein
MSMRRFISLAAIAVLGIAWFSADAFAARAGARGGAVAARGAVGVRGGAVADRGGLGYRGGPYGGGYYRPGLGLAAGAVVGGAIAASQPGYGYGGYGYGDDTGYGYNPGYTAAYYGSPGGYNTYPNDAYSYPLASASYASDTGYAGGCSTFNGKIMCNGQCWLDDNATNYRWGDCQAIHVKAH